MLVAIILLSASFLILSKIIFIIAYCFIQRFSAELEKISQNNFYICTLLLSTHFNSEEEKIITDFSLYENKNIVGMTAYTTQSIPVGYTKEELEEMVIIPKALLYQDQNGVWRWEQI